MPSITNSSHIHNFLFHPLEIKDQDEKRKAIITCVALTALSLGVWLVIAICVNRLDNKRVKKGEVDTDPSKKPVESDSDEENISIPDLTIEQCRNNALAKGIKIPANYRVDQYKFMQRAATSIDIPTPNFGQKELKILLNEVSEVKKWTGNKGNIVNNNYDLGMEQIFDSGLVTLGIKNTPMNKIFKHQYKVVLDIISKMPEKKEKELKFKKLAEAFKACQPEQARVINGMYAQFMGLGGTFESQMASWIEEKKKELFEQCIYELHPNCKDEKKPKDQLPHLTSGYLALLGNALGMPDVDKAFADHNANFDNSSNKDRFLVLFWQKLKVEDLSRELVSQINQSLGDRFTDEQLVKWCNSNDCFQLCYFMGNNIDLYYQQPTEDQFYISKPFISEFGALKILEKMGYISHNRL